MRGMNQWQIVNNLINLGSQTVAMNVKKMMRVPKDSFSIRNTIDNECIDERTRVIQKNLVFANGIPPDLHHKQILSQSTYFGRYGKINKIIINSNHKPNNCHAYVTYETQLEASIAIVALNGYSIDSRPLKVSYGTTKYCTSFLKGYQCKNNDCIYLHKLNKKLEFQADDSKNTFKEQTQEAFKIVSRNLDYVGLRMMDEDGEQEGFPNLSEMVDFLIQTQFIEENQIENIKNHYPPKLTTIVSSPPLHQDNQSPKECKLIKSNSFSTICTPEKSTVGEQPLKVQKKKQSKIHIRRMKLEQKVQQMMIRKFLNPKGPHRSPLGFVRERDTNEREMMKIKRIIQEQLIAK